MRYFKKRVLAYVVTLLLMPLVLSGCATGKMALQGDTEQITNTSNPIVLVSVTLRNTLAPSHQPELNDIWVKKLDELNTGTGNPKEEGFKMDEKGKSETGSLPDGNNYLIRLALNPGRHIIQHLNSQSSSFLIKGRFFTQLNAPVEIKGPGVYYLGHIGATVRKKNSGEDSAGPPIPIIDQAAVGASGGTFDIEITDQFDTDSALFISRFPALRGVAIQKAVLPPIQR